VAAKAISWRAVRLRGGGDLGPLPPGGGHPRGAGLPQFSAPPQ
jgi:hypothetical protein